MAIYKKFLDGKPEYLVRYYWWAYLWKSGVWFFDHQPIINAILFGQYRNLMHATMDCLESAPRQRVLQLTCVYGELTPKLAVQVDGPLHITDVAEVQLDLARSKVSPDKLLATRMNAEYLGYKDDSFSTTVIFFLMHEMPSDARTRMIREAVRVTRPGGRIIVTEYAPLPTMHLLYRFLPFRWTLTKLEPFLESFWHTDLPGELGRAAELCGKQIEPLTSKPIFGHFYQVSDFHIRT